MRLFLTFTQTVILRHAKVSQQISILHMSGASGVAGGSCPPSKMHQKNCALSVKDGYFKYAGIQTSDTRSSALLLKLFIQRKDRNRKDNLVETKVSCVFFINI